MKVLLLVLFGIVLIDKVACLVPEFQENDEKEIAGKIAAKLFNDKVSDYATNEEDREDEELDVIEYNDAKPKWWRRRSDRRRRWSISLCAGWKNVKLCLKFQKQLKQLAAIQKECKREHENCHIPANLVETNTL